VRLHDLAFEPVEGPQLRALQEPESRRGARSRAAHGGAGRAQEALRRVLTPAHGGRTLRLSLFPAAGLRRKAGLRRLRADSDVRRDLSVDAEREVEREVRFDYDRGDLHEKYASGRALAPAQLALWAPLISDLPGSASIRRVVDVGCGTGRFSAWL